MQWNQRCLLIPFENKTFISVSSNVPQFYNNQKKLTQINVEQLFVCRKLFYLTIQNGIKIIETIVGVYLSSLSLSITPKHQQINSG